MWVPGHKGIDEIERADESARQDSSQPLIGPKECSGTGQAGKSPFMDKGRLRVFLKDPQLKQLEKYLT